ncbi:MULTISPECIES: DUF4326 domain-containing protein [unclassified Marinovum]|uniref:DUF4326 domain-containing protein n=1 Tax=unclassified Marinovum TaxID=2647166 RepID=UPI003EDC4F1B
MTPKRIQMSRQRPWRKDHPDAVIVARRSRWGNPYRVGVHGDAATCTALYHQALLGLIDNIRQPAPPVQEVLDQPCHADALLKLANGDA